MEVNMKSYIAKLLAARGLRCDWSSCEGVLFEEHFLIGATVISIHRDTGEYIWLIGHGPLADKYLYLIPTSQSERSRASRSARWMLASI